MGSEMCIRDRGRIVRITAPKSPLCENTNPENTVNQNIRQTAASPVAGPSGHKLVTVPTAPGTEIIAGREQETGSGQQWGGTSQPSGQGLDGSMAARETVRPAAAKPLAPDRAVWQEWNTVGPSSVHLAIRLQNYACLLYTSPSPRDLSTSRMPSSA